MPGNAFQLLPAFQSRGPFDLVVAGGLFDYVPDTLLKRYLPRIVATLLRPGGELLFTNIAPENPYRVWLEYFARWPLIERSESELRSLVKKCAIESADVRRDESGLALLFRARKASDIA